jgi:hypothetical protein
MGYDSTGGQGAAMPNNDQFKALLSSHAEGDEAQCYSIAKKITNESNPALPVRFSAVLQLSNGAKEARKPPPPADLVDSIQTPIRRELGGARVAHAVKASRS